MEPSEEIVFEDEELKPTLAPVGFDKAVDILSAWIHKKFFAEKSTDDSGFKGDEEEEAQSESSEGSKIQFKIKSSTPLRPNVKDFETSLDENDVNEASTSKSDPIFDDYEVVDDEYQEDLDDYQKKLKELSYDNFKRDIIKRSRQLKPNPTFISKNPDERADIDDPRWEEVKKMKTDRERKEYAMKEFGNIAPADPTKSLTYFGFARAQIALKEGLEPDDKDYIRHPIRLEKGRIELNEPIVTSDRKRKATDHQDAPDPKRRKVDRRSIPLDSFTERLEHIAVQYKQKLIPPKDLKYFLRHWRYDLDETVSFYRYYDESNEDEVDVNELNKSDCIEFIHNQSTNFYGTPKPQWCRDCSYEDDKNVAHCL